MRPSILVDTGPLVALLNKHDALHDVCRDQLGNLDPPLLTTWPVLTEATWLLRSRQDLVEKLIFSVGDSLLRLAWLDEADVDPMAGILNRYADQSFQLADVSLMHVAERQNINVVFTLDRRDFSIYRKSDGSALTLIPESHPRHR